MIIVPDHLQALYQHLDWVGISLDHLVETTHIDVATLSSQLMEMELLGFAVQQAGLYQRCRQ
jgi:DNA processing protein